MREGAQGALARILVLDQFTRNAHRNTPRSFAGDALALAAARQLVDSGADRELPPLQRAFAYMPFEHAEDALHAGARRRAVRRAGGRTSGLRRNARLRAPPPRRDRALRPLPAP
jgi:uncharacterized protein (DUF924 family)